MSALSLFSGNGRRSLLGGVGRRFAGGFSLADIEHKNMNALPRLPVPKFDDTIERYLGSVGPLTTSDQFTEHEALVRDFQKSAGPILHEKLLAMDEQNAAGGSYPHSYIESDWDEMYFGGRWALPINSNPFYILKRDGNSGTEKQVPRTARFVTAALKWVRKLREPGSDYFSSTESHSGLEPDKATGCMSQYHLQFGTGRVPNRGRDVLKTDQGE
jgi:hypothetical protein